MSDHRLNGHAPTTLNGAARLPLPPFANGNGSPPPDGGRDPKTGQFTKGNKGGPGNPHARHVAQLRQAFLEAATPQRMQQLADKLFALALAGDVAAARLFLEHSVGRPAAAPDPDRLDLEELRLYRDMPDVKQLVALLHDRVAAGLVAGLARETVPDTPEGLQQFLGAAARRLEEQRARALGVPPLDPEVEAILHAGGAAGGGDEEE